MPTQSHHEPTITLSPDSLEDLIYFSRASDLPSLREALTLLSATYSTTQTQVLLSAYDPASENTLLHYPSANGSIEVLNYLLSLVPPPSSHIQAAPASTAALYINSQNGAGNTALHWAALNGHMACVQALVEKGADPAMLNKAGKDAVWEAEHGGKEGEIEVAEWLEREGRGLDRGVGGGDVDTEREDEVEGGVNGSSAGEDGIAGNLNGGSDHTGDG
ncbi:MAG: hypothetical protein Q9160_004576 [Pyrenula sp. 1 TL-2023]